MEQDQITEIVAYTIKPDTDIQVMRGKINEIIRTFDGYISHQTMQNPTNHLAFVDMVIWQNLESAKAAQEAFHKHPGTAELAELFEETQFFTHLKPL